MGFTDSLAENAGFEPAGRFEAPGPLARGYLRPLGQFSKPLGRGGAHNRD